MPTSFRFEVNWSGDGVTFSDESANVLQAQVKLGMGAGFLSAVADVGTCALTLDNATMRYSPDNAAGALYGQLVPRRQLRVRATDGLTTWTIFRGFIERIAPEAGVYGRRRVLIEGVDAIALLKFQRISLPLQQNQRADQLIATIVSATYTPPATNYRPGNDTFDVAADQWNAEHTAALSAIQQCAESEFGRFFIQRDGTPTFYDRRWAFAPLTPALTLNASPITLAVRRDADQVYNSVKVIAHPRATLSLIGVLAQANSALRIPPIGPSGAGVRDVTLRFRDASTGQFVGGTGLIVPLVPYVDYAINEKPDGSLADYTASPYFALSVTAALATEIKLRLQNSALGALYATKLQVRGQAIIAYDPLIFSREDTGSQAAYQKRALTHDLTLSADADLAESLATYLLDRYSSPFTRVDSVTIQNDALINSTNVFSLNLFDLLSLTDSQTGISAMLCWIVGLRLHITPAGFTLTWLTERADDRVYWSLGVVGRGELGTNTRLAV